MHYTVIVGVLQDEVVTNNETTRKQFCIDTPCLSNQDILTSGDPGGMTADEIGEKLVSEGKIPTNSPNFTRPRLTEMKAEGKVMIVGRRPGKSGCNTAVWKVKR